jgi:PPOX class probable FMN-dependent enzyme
MDTPDPHAITSLEALGALYAEPSETVRNKVGARMGPATRRFIAASPFCLLGTIGPEGPHVTPRGDAQGFVTVADDHTLILPDRRGNNRLDALRDILHDPRVTLLFLVPGNGETLRVHGRARITADPALCAAHRAEGKLPATVLVVAVESLFMQCAKALIRSRLWQGGAKPGEAQAGGGTPGVAKPSDVPTLGVLVAEHTAGRHGGAAFDAALPQRYRETLY